VVLTAEGTLRVVDGANAALVEMEEDGVKEKAVVLA